jgi:hypothetical protein
MKFTVKLPRVKHFSKIVKKGRHFAKKTIQTANRISNGVEKFGNDVVKFHDNHEGLFNTLNTAAQVGMKVAPYVAPLLL